MEEYSPEQYGQRIAEAYDEFYASVDDACLELLTQLSQDGRVLELSIGTGRIASPLKTRWVNISEIDISPAMVE